MSLDIRDRRGPIRVGATRPRPSLPLAAATLLVLAPIPARAGGPPVPIVGTALDADRHPAAGAGVFFSLRPRPDGEGEVVARTNADAQGRFRLNIPSAPGGGPGSGLLWAYRPGSLVAWYRVARETVPPDWPVTMVLDHPARAEFLVRGPDGRPIAGARIHPNRLRGEPYSVPAELSDRIAADTVTDARGRAVLTAVFPEELSAASVSAPGLGRQRFGAVFRGGQLEVETLDLRAVGRIEGQVVADDPAIGRGRKLEVSIQDQQFIWPALGLFSATTDARGRFAIAEAPVGDLSVVGIPPAGSPWFIRTLTPWKVEAGRTTRVELWVERGIRLRGVVRERGTGRPIAGVGLTPFGAQGRDDSTVTTDAEGRFSLFAQRDLRLIAGPIPAGYAPPYYSPRTPRVPPGSAEVEFPPIELSRAGTVAGDVIDDRGEPVPGAVVLASYPVDGGGIARGQQDRRAVAGARGEFRFPDVVEGAPVALSAIAPDGRRTARPVESHAGDPLARLVVGPSGPVSLAGRVVDASGRRVAGARVRLRMRGHPSGPRSGDGLVEIRGAYTIRTHGDGWFRTPPILEPDGVYLAIAEADDYGPARTAWTIGKSRMFDQIVLQPRAEPEAPAGRH